MSINNGLFTSNSDMWETPQHLFDALDATYRFTLDVCATAENAKCKDYFTPEIDGLSQVWRGMCWMNPPYGREIGKWVKKAHEESRKYGCTVVCLLPARTDTRWFHDYIWDESMGPNGDWRNGVSGRLIRGRLKFGGSKNSAPFPSMVVIFE